MKLNVLKRNDAKVVRCGISLAIRVVVMPRSSSIESTMSVCGDGERNVCITVDQVHSNTQSHHKKHTVTTCLTCINVSFNNLSSV